MAKTLESLVPQLDFCLQMKDGGLSQDTVLCWWHDNDDGKNKVELTEEANDILGLKGPYEKTGFALRLYPKGWGVYTGAIQHVSKRNVFAMLEWLHEQQAKPRKELFNPKEVLYDQNRSHNAGL